MDLLVCEHVEKEGSAQVNARSHIWIVFRKTVCSKCNSFKPQSSTEDSCCCDLWRLHFDSTEYDLAITTCASVKASLTGTSVNMHHSHLNLLPQRRLSTSYTTDPDSLQVTERY